MFPLSTSPKPSCLKLMSTKQKELPQESEHGSIEQFMRFLLRHTPKPNNPADRKVPDYLRNISHAVYEDETGICVVTARNISGGVGVLEVYTSEEGILLYSSPFVELQLSFNPWTGKLMSPFFLQGRYNDKSSDNVYLLSYVQNVTDPATASLKSIFRSTSDLSKHELLPIETLSGLGTPFVKDVHWLYSYLAYLTGRVPPEEKPLTPQFIQANPFLPLSLFEQKS